MPLCAKSSRALDRIRSLVSELPAGRPGRLRLLSGAATL
ncbi:hypothetical protein CO60_3276 [Mycobacterium tuberculosis]|nr:hypothetical protein CO60_3276 [Mycobacterium tuberculosis]